MTADAVMLSHLMRRRAGHSLPRALYVDPDMLAVDIDAIWARDWLFATAACALPKTGAHIVMEIGDWSVIVVRGGDGAIRAFHNACRHRGSRLCKAARGSAPKLVCPYHQWTYELDGRLLYARDMGPDFDPARHGLKPVHCRDAGGLVFVCLAETPPPFDALADAAAAYLGPSGLDAAKLAHETAIEEAGDWKLVMENNRECYHCSGSHPALCRTFDDNPAAAGVGGLSAPMLEAHVARCEAAGLPARYRAAPDRQWRMVRVPLLGAATSYTMDGGRACAKLMGTMPFADAGTLLVYHYPNMWAHFLGDSVTLFRMTPLGPGRTEVTTQWLVHRDAAAGADYDLTRLTEVWEATNAEDRRVVEENQRGVRSPAYEPGPYSPTQEAGVIEFVDWYVATMTARLTGRALTAAE